MDKKLAFQLERLAALKPQSNTGKTMIPADCEDIPPLLKALLVADGTVTIQVEAAFGERIRVTNVAQSVITSPCSITMIHVTTGDEIFHRCVDLVGAESNLVYVTAWSILNGTIMDSELFHKLIGKEVGMGEVLRNAARGSYREVLHIERDLSTNVVTRNYVVFLNAAPCILINETFPIDRFRN